MKSILVFLFLMVFVVCPPPHEFNRERIMQRRKEFQKNMVDCIFKSNASADLKKQVEDNKEDDLRKVLHLYMNKLDTSDREIIRDCRRELFNKMREMYRGFHDRFNHTGPHGFGHGFGSARDHEPREGHHPSASISKPQNN